MQDPITLYYWPTPNGWKISIALEEMCLPYRVNLIDISKGDQFAPDFLQMPRIPSPMPRIATGPKLRGFTAY